VGAFGANSKFQQPNINERGLGFRILNLFGAWNLELGISAGVLD
jgi:hypothetical protein